MIKDIQLVFFTTDPVYEWSNVLIKQWKKEQASRCCTADVCLCQSVNQRYNNKKLTNLFFFPLFVIYPREKCEKLLE